MKLPVIAVSGSPSGKRPLMRHQQSCIDWVVRNRIRHPGLFLEMRLGKTLTTVRLVSQAWKVTGACLVVAPITVLEAWEKELSIEGEEYVVAHGLSKQKRIAAAQVAFFSGKRMWCLINYDSLRATPGLTKLPWKVVVLDESTVIKNPTAKISQLCGSGFRDVEHRLVLSGLPSPEGELNLFSQFRFLHGRFMGHENYYRFRATHFTPASEYASDWNPLPESKQLIKDEVHKLAYVLRRQDAGMRGKKIREVRGIKMLPDQSKTYALLEREFSTWLDRGDHEELSETEHAIVKYTWLAHIAGGFDAESRYQWNPKVKELVNLITGELSGQPVIVWYRFNSELHQCAKELARLGVSYRTLTGEITKREDRKAVLEWFRNSKNPHRVLLCQIKLAKYGVDASVADTAIYFSMTSSCEEIAQSEERIFHPMKTTPLLYVYLVTRESVDEDILYAVNNKITSSKLFMSRVKESMLKRIAS